MEKTHFASLPPVPDYRYHVLMVLQFVRLYLLVVDHDLMPEYDFVRPGYLDVEKVNELTERVMTAGKDDELPMSEEDVKVLYACYFLMNQLLVSEAGEVLMDQILQQLIDEGVVRNFEDFRARCLEINGRLIEDTEEKFASDIPDFDAWKAIVAEGV